MATDPSPGKARTLTALLAQCAKRWPEGECLRFAGRSLTFTEVERGVNRLASVLLASGVEAGQRVAIMVPNGLGFPIAWLAAIKLRAVAVPVHVTYGPTDLRHVFELADVRHALVGSEQKEVVLDVVKRLPASVAVRVLDDSGWLDDSAGLDHSGLWGVSGVSKDRPLDVLNSALVAPAEPNDPVSIQFTSGTTGLPRGCVLDHSYWLGVARAFQGALRLGPHDVLLTSQPQTYMDPSWNLILALMAGAPLVVLPRFSASGFWEDVRRNQVTFFYCIGTMPLYLLKQPPDAARDRAHSVKMVYCSGIPTALHSEFEERWGCPWRETYGTTELGAVLVVEPDDDASVGTGDMGRAVQGRQVRVVADSGAEAPAGIPGELQVRGPGSMQHYYRDPDATVARRTSGWERTGDVVVRSEDGRIRLVGRTNDMIRRAGENISAAEVEAVLGQHPYVRAAACIAVPDTDRGEELKAYLLPVGTQDPSMIDPAEVHSFVAAKLAPFKVPRYIEAVDTLPLTPSQKIAKAELIDSRADHRVGAWDAEARPGP